MSICSVGDTIAGGPNLELLSMSQSEESISSDFHSSGLELSIYYMDDQFSEWAHFLCTGGNIEGVVDDETTNFKYFQK